MNSKLQWLRNKMNSLDMQGMIISNPLNIKYLTNIDAEGTLLITRKENIYITNAYLETGDYYFDKGDNQKALKAFLLAKKSLEKYEHSQESEQSIELRLNDLKSILPRNIIDKVIQDVENNGR